MYVDKPGEGTETEIPSAPSQGTASPVTVSEYAAHDEEDDGT